MNRRKILKQLKKKKHSNPLEGVKNVISSLEVFESDIADDIGRFNDPDFLNIEDEDEDEEEEDEDEEVEIIQV